MSCVRECVSVGGHAQLSSFPWPPLYVAMYLFVTLIALMYFLLVSYRLCVQGLIQCFQMSSPAVVGLRKWCL